jgi:hypothetical protein
MLECFGFDFLEEVKFFFGRDESVAKHTQDLPIESSLFGKIA